MSTACHRRAASNSRCCPPDNATGNFTKIVQRVPVKIVLDDHGLTGLLRPGMSAEPTINTKATVLAERRSRPRSFPMPPPRFVERQLRRSAGHYQAWPDNQPSLSPIIET